MSCHALAERTAPVVRPALKVGAVNDPAELEADAVADLVMAMPGVAHERVGPSDTPAAAPTVRRSCGCGCAGGCGGETEDLRRQADDDEEEIQLKPATDVVRRADEGEDEELQMSPAAARGAGALDTRTTQRIQATRGTGAPLASDVRRFFEPRFAADLSGVRVHADHGSAEMAASIHARAFTVGRDVYFGSGEYAPSTESGRHLIAHELTHTMQPNPSTVGTVRRRVRANRVTCRNSPPTSAVIRAIGTADPVGALDAADRRAIEMLDFVIGELQAGRTAIRGGAPLSWPTISDAVFVALRDRLGLDPDDRAVWTGVQALSINTVIRRFQGARRLLAEGFLRYQCLGSPVASSHPGCTGPDCNADDWASTCPPSLRVVLCQRFWNDGNEQRALTLLHEAMHIFFPVVGDTGNFANAGCYDQMIADLHGMADQGVC